MSNAIMIVDDDRNICAITKVYLQKNGFQVTVAYTGKQALEAAAKQAFALIVLDLMLPELDGWTVCRMLREASDVPIIMLTARGETDDKITGLRMGADDYIIKPFDPNELVARIETVLRRTRNAAGSSAAVAIRSIAIGDLRMDKSSYEAIYKDKPIPLKRREFELLFFLAEHPNRVFTRDELIHHVWGWDYEGEERTVDVCVKRIREYFEKDSLAGWSVDTVWGVGYKFRVDT